MREFLSHCSILIRKAEARFPSLSNWENDGTNHKEIKRMYGDFTGYIKMSRGLRTAL